MGNPVVFFLLIAFLEFATPFFTSSIPPRVQFRHGIRRRLPSVALYGRPVDYEDDYYAALGLMRSASPDEIKSAFRKKARLLHPDRFAEELRFDPSSMQVSELRAFLAEQNIGTAGLFERSDFNELAKEAHKRNDSVPKALASRREEVTDKFALVNAAYTTLHDEKARRLYDLSGEWGTGTSGSGTKSADTSSTGYNDVKRQQNRAEAARQESMVQRQREARQARERAENAQAAAAAQRKATRQMEDIARKIRWWEKETPEEIERRKIQRAEEERRDAAEAKLANERRKARLQEEDEAATRREAARVAAIQQNAQREKVERESACARAAEEKKRVENERLARERRAQAAAEAKVAEQKRRRQAMEEEKRIRDEERRKEYEKATTNSQDDKFERELQLMMKRYKLGDEKK